MTLPGGWQLCDGSVIESGVLRGTNTPDINGEGGDDNNNYIFINDKKY